MPGLNKVSSIDIARLAGVSQSTVSRVLNHNPRITTGTRDKVLAAMQQLNYVPSAPARALITGRSHLVGLIVSNITNPFYPQLVESIVTAAERHEYNVILGNTLESPRRQMDYLRLLDEHQVDGIILTSTLDSSENALRTYVKRGKPVVLVNRVFEEAFTDSVHIDNRLAGYRATEHLIGLGHSRIAFAGGRPGTSSNRQRLLGYAQALIDPGIAFDNALVFSGDFSHLSGVVTAKRILALSDPPSAVVCADDSIAIGLMDTLIVAGVSVPEDVAIVGFDDVPTASLKSIELTTIRQPTGELGKRALQILLRRISGEETGAPIDEVLPGELVVRRSSGAKSGARLRVHEGTSVSRRLYPLSP